jgi:hypothetical protein
MFTLKIHAKLFVILLCCGLLAGMALCGCKSSQQTPSPATQPSFALFGPPPQKSPVQLWSENCARCHNSRPTNEFSSAQWDVIVHHMRLRANLTGKEARDIVAFLQSTH